MKREPKCERIRRLLHLYRDGELTGRQTKKLERHLHSCRACSLEKQQIDAAARKISLAREASPGPADPALLTRSIMEKIEDEAYGHASDYPEPNKIAAFIQRLTTPHVRLAALCATVLIVGLFLFQGTMLLHRITILEEKMAARSFYAVPDTLSATNPRVALASIMDKMEDMYDGMPDDKEYVIVDKGTLRKLMKFYRRWREKDGKLLQKMRDKIPLLNRFEEFKTIKKFPKSRISREELKKLLENKESILKNLEKSKHWRTL